MSIPKRNAGPDSIRYESRTFFVSSKTTEGKALLQSERMATLLIDVFRSCVSAGRFKIHDFVVMPNHIHLLVTLDQTMSIEKAVQFIKGGFSYRVKKELGFTGEIWQRGFSEVRVFDRESFLKHRSYIDNNPVEAGLAETPEKYPYGSAYFRHKKAAAKAG
jgi:putative transposase